MTSISYETGILFGKITLFAAGNKAEILQTSKSSVKVFVDHIRTKLSDSVRHNSISGKPDETNDRIAALERLSKLKSDGILTEEEFQKEKQSILNQLWLAALNHRLRHSQQSRSPLFILLNYTARTSQKYRTVNPGVVRAVECSAWRCLYPK